MTCFCCRRWIHCKARALATSSGVFDIHAICFKISPIGGAHICSIYLAFLLLLNSEAFLMLLGKNKRIQMYNSHTNQRTNFNKTILLTAPSTTSTSSSYRVKSVATVGLIPFYQGIFQEPPPYAHLLVLEETIATESSPTRFHDLLPSFSRGLDSSFSNHKTINTTKYNEIQTQIPLLPNRTTDTRK